MRLRSLMGDERGAIAIEFAVCFPLLFAAFLSVTELSTFYWARGTLQFATEEAARTAVVNPRATAAQVKSVLTTALARTGNFDAGRLELDAVVEPDGGVNFMRVTARYPWPTTGVSGFFPFDFGAAVGEARMPMLQ